MTGNLKYDAIETNRTNAKSDACRVIAREFGISDSDQILIAGSTQIEDEEVSVDAWLELRKTIDNLKLIIVPRHPDRIAEVEKLLSSRGLNANRRSHHRSSVSDSDILIVDVIGELSGWWALADVAFVGGRYGVAWWAEHDRTGGLWNSSLLRTEHFELQINSEWIAFC